MLPTNRPFEIVSKFKPTGDQPGAIEALVKRVNAGEKWSCLLGATGTGKTFTMAHLIQRTQKPTLILSHNKTLAAQLYEEMRELFPNNAVSYFVSYYDYYQPEAYIPQRDLYIEKDASRNDDLDKLRLAATSNILSRRDTIVVASVSCIFGLGSPEAYGAKVLTITRGMKLDRRRFFLALDAMQYKRAEMEFARGNFRVRGDVVDVYPAYEQYALRVEMFGDEVERISLINPTSGEELAEEKQFFLFPANHYVMPEDRMHLAIRSIREEMEARVTELRTQGKLLEAQRLLARTKYDLEMLEEVGVCQGVENYSRHLDGRPPGAKPWTLMDYFDYSPEPFSAEAAFDDAIDLDALAQVEKPGSNSQAEHDNRKLYRLTKRPEHDWLLIIDESHVTLPQVRAMYNGDRMRKLVLVDHGFRLPSALDNRPLRFEEFEEVVPQVMFVSATPGPYELERVGGDVVEQVIRPTGLLDPQIEMRPAEGQVPDLLKRCQAIAAKGQRVLVTALTKRLCEDLTLYLHQHGVKVRYLHSEIETLERLQILTELRMGQFDVLVGVNLLREGLDLPEVSLVAILDADKEGFLRSPTSLVQLIGRAARNVEGHVVMYADKVTPAMEAAIGETNRRRDKQIAYNKEHGITPMTIQKAIRRGLETEIASTKAAKIALRDDEPSFAAEQLEQELTAEMMDAAAAMEFEKAAKLRDQITKLKTFMQQKGAEGKGKVAVKRSELEESGKSSNRQQSTDRKPGMPGVKPTRRGKKGGGKKPG